MQIKHMFIAVFASVLLLAGCQSSSVKHGGLGASATPPCPTGNSFFTANEQNFKSYSGGGYSEYSYETQPVGQPGGMLLYKGTDSLSDAIEVIDSPYHTNYVQAKDYSYCNYKSKPGASIQFQDVPLNDKLTPGAWIIQ